MLQPTRSSWKKAAFQALAQTERMVRGKRVSACADHSRIQNFLVLQQEAPLGSVVHATPLFEALRQALPGCHITVAASPMAVSVLQHNPYIDRCVLTPNPFNEFRNSIQAVRGLLEAMPPGPRSMITTIGNQRTRLALLSLLMGDALRVGYTLAPELYDVPLFFQPERGQIQGNLDIVHGLGHDVHFYEPKIFFTNADRDRTAEWLASAVSSAGATRIAFVTQNSGGQRNQWSTARFQQAIENLTRELDAFPVFLGTAREAAAIDALRQELPKRGISLAGKTTIPELAAVLAQCDLIVSLDTGTFHVARAVGLPGVVIAPAWQSPLEWLPVDAARYRVLRGPTLQQVPPNYWIEEISVDQVCAAAFDLMRKFPADATQRAARVEYSVR